MSSFVTAGKCEVIGQKVYTYDKESIHYPETDCEIILAKDCSSRSSPSFMVTTKDKNKDENKKVGYFAFRLYICRFVQSL